MSPLWIYVFLGSLLSCLATESSMQLSTEVEILGDVEKKLLDYTERVGKVTSKGKLASVYNMFMNGPALDDSQKMNSDFYWGNHYSVLEGLNNTINTRMKLVNEMHIFVDKVEPAQMAELWVTVKKDVDMAITDTLRALERLETFLTSAADLPEPIKVLADRFVYGDCAEPPKEDEELAKRLFDQMIGNGDFKLGKGIEQEYNSYGPSSIVNIADENLPKHWSAQYALDLPPRDTGGGQYEVHNVKSMDESRAGDYILSASVFITEDFDGDLRVLHARFWDNNDKELGVTTGDEEGAKPTMDASKRGKWQPLTVLFTTTEAPARFSLYLGYPANHKHGHMYITDVQVRAPSICRPTSRQQEEFPECQSRMQWMSVNWKYNRWYWQNGVDGSVCSIMKYLVSEKFCPYPENVASKTFMMEMDTIIKGGVNLNGHSSMIFENPVNHASSLPACKKRCEKDDRCFGFVFYPSTYHDERWQQVCVLKASPLAPMTTSLRDREAKGVQVGWLPDYDTSQAMDCGNVQGNGAGIPFLKETTPDACMTKCLYTPSKCGGFSYVARTGDQYGAKGNCYFYKDTSVARKDSKTRDCYRLGPSRKPQLYSGDIASGKRVVASSEWSDDFSAIKATSPEFAKQFWASVPGEPAATLVIDLGDIYMLAKIMLRWKYFASTYTVDVSLDKEKWDTVFKTNTKESDKMDSINAYVKAARYVRINLIKAGTTYDGPAKAFVGKELYGIYAVRVFSLQETISGNAGGKLLPQDFARLKAATASQNHEKAMSPLNGDIESFWSSGPVTSNQAPVTWTLDLKRLLPIGRVFIDWKFPARRYRLYGSSDGTTYKMLHEQTSLDSASAGRPVEQMLGVAGAARFLKLEMIRASSEHAGFGLRNFRVYCTEHSLFTPEEFDDVAKGRTIDATSSYGENASPEKMVDADPKTFWASAANTEQGIINLDLGQAYALSMVVLEWRYLAKQYTLEISMDGEEYENVFNQLLGAGGTEILDLSFPARYLRLDMREAYTVKGVHYLGLVSFRAMAVPIPMDGMNLWLDATDPHLPKPKRNGTDADANVPSAVSLPLKLWQDKSGNKQNAYALQSCATETQEVCKFPFMYNGELQYSCIDNDHNRYWCLTGNSSSTKVVDKKNCAECSSEPPTWIASAPGLNNRAVVRFSNYRQSMFLPNGLPLAAGADRTFMYVFAFQNQPNAKDGAGGGSVFGTDTEHRLEYLADSKDTTADFWTVIGCYKDTETRDLTNIQPGNNWNARSCAAEARKLGHQYFGLQSGGQCYTGNSYGKYGKADNCNKPCFSPTTDNCGGEWANLVYAVGGSGNEGNRLKMFSGTDRAFSPSDSIPYGANLAAFSVKAGKTQAFQNGQALTLMEGRGGPTSSTRSCAEMGWKVSGQVCAATDAPNLGGCSGMIEYDVAVGTCTKAGGRLCTITELMAGVADGTGCDYEKERVWSSTRTGCPPGFIKTIAGGKEFLSAQPQTCTEAKQKAYTRCCGDVTPKMYEPNTLSWEMNKRSFYIGTDGPSTDPNPMKSCGELGWALPGGGSSTVCAGSDSTLLGGCSGMKKYEDAKAHCRKAGARLCTLAEIMTDETKGSGCDYEKQRVWTSTEQGCREGEVYTAAGSKEYITKVPDQCTPKTAEVGVARCCADAKIKGETGFIGDMAEILMWNRELTLCERLKTEKYLGKKYGLEMGAASKTGATFTQGALSANSFVVLNEGTTKVGKEFSTGDFSIVVEVSLSFSGASSWQTIALGGDGCGGFMLGLYHRNLRFGRQCGPQPSSPVTLDQADGTRVNIAVTYNHKEATFWVDGEKRGSIAVDVKEFLPSKSTNLIVGAGNEAGGEKWKGAIRGISFFPKILDDANIIQMTTMCK